jgi:hypothetical protein
MPVSMHQASAPLFLRQLKALSAILTTAEQFAEAKKIDPSVLINARLAPDMHPLSRQVQIASDGVKGGVARLAGMEPPSYPDTETTFAELQARIANTIAFIESVPAEKLDGSEDRTITLKLGPNEFSFPGLTYLSHFVIPNFYFHVTTAYNILRHNGVEIGKRDFLGGI